MAGKYCKNPKVPGAQLNVNPARAITWFVGVTIYCTFFNNNSPPSRQFFMQLTTLKKIATVRGMLIVQKFELRGPGPCSRLDCYLLQKNFAGGNVLYFPLPGAKSLAKFNPKMQDFKRVLDLNCQQKEYSTT